MYREICGDPRAGKTALATSFAVPRMKGVHARRDVKACEKYLAPLTEFPFVAPPDHMLFSTWTILADIRGKVRNYEVDPFQMRLFIEGIKTQFLPPAAQIYVDEAQTYYNSREKISELVSLYYQWHGHYHLNITTVSQRPMQIDVNIRELAAEVLYVHGLEHKKENGRIVASEWTCYSYDNPAAAVAYIEGGKKKEQRGDTVRYTFEGNIFKHYNSFDHFALFLKGNFNEKFDLRHSVPTGFTRLEIEDYNNQHDYASPDDYYKKGGSKNGGGKTAKLVLQ